MAKLFIHPRYHDWLQQLGLCAAGDFLKLSGVIICGHPDRNVAHVRLGDDERSLSLYLKREHRVRWRDRLTNQLAGFGFVSKSCKEMKLRPELARHNIASPEILAAGESGGQAFLLAREMERASDLRRFLQENPNPRMRRQLARQLGAELARIHQSGLAHRDLYAKHVLVEPAGDGFLFHFLDWQRSRLAGSVSWGQRCRDLGTLHATLADGLATPRERLACLIAYVRACSSQVILRQDRTYLASTIRAMARTMLRKRHIRELRQPPLPAEQQNLVWLDGEALCVTKEFRNELRGEVPDWLPRLRTEGQAEAVVEKNVVLPGGGSAKLIRRQAMRPFRWLWHCLRLRALPSPELELAATVFRLQRFGVALPRVLAVGQHRRRPWQSSSFLLTEEPVALRPLGTWLNQAFDWQRHRTLREVAEQLRRIHQAGYRFRAGSDVLHAFGVSGADQGAWLRSACSLTRDRRPRRKHAVCDLRRLLKQARTCVTRTEALRFLQAYLHGGDGALAACWEDRSGTRARTDGTVSARELRGWIAAILALRLRDVPRAGKRDKLQGVLSA